jgi:hypothetical protein
VLKAAFLMRIKIGSIKSQVSAPGFSSTTQENIVLHVQDRVAADITRQDGGIDTALSGPDYGDPAIPKYRLPSGSFRGRAPFQKNTPDSRFFQFALKHIF